MTSTLFQCDEDWADKWPARGNRSRRRSADPPRCDRCGCDLTDEPVSVLSRHCRACVDQILAELEREP